jgi:hypothetical protein
LEEEILAAGEVVELHVYPGNDHNLRQSFSDAMARTLDFYGRYLK